VQDEVPPLPRGAGVARRVVRARRGDHAREQCGLPRLQLFDAQLVAGRAAFEVIDVLAKVRLRGGLDAVGAAAEVDRVEVRGEDLFLGPLV